MIELIFAIVVIGIVLMSAPNLLKTATESGYVAIQQEAINEAATHLNIVMSYHWDEQDTDPRFIPPILKVNVENTELEEFNNTGRRMGTPAKSLRSFVRADGVVLAASANLGLDAGESKGDEDDVDDFNGEDYSLTLVQNAAADYVEKTTINIRTSLAYIGASPTSSTFQQNVIAFNPAFSASAGDTTNIKRIRVVLTSTSGENELSKNIILNAFVCNIGATQLVERDF